MNCVLTNVRKFAGMGLGAKNSGIVNPIAAGGIREYRSGVGVNEVSEPSALHWESKSNALADP